VHAALLVEQGDMLTSGEVLNLQDMYRDAVRRRG
jgi:hypothetical protein